MACQGGAECAPLICKGNRRPLHVAWFGEWGNKLHPNMHRTRKLDSRVWSHHTRGQQRMNAHCALQQTLVKHARPTIYCATPQKNEGAPETPTHHFTLIKEQLFCGCATTTVCPELGSRLVRLAVLLNRAISIGRNLQKCEQW